MNNKSIFRGKTAVVTGASRGIGSAVAIELAKNGCNVVINYRQNANAAESVKQAITEYSMDALVIQADIAIEKDVKRLFDEAINRFGKIDILINNAGIVFDKDFEERTVSDWRKTLDTNLIGTFLMCKYFGQHMFKNKYGKIVNVSSTNGINSYFPTSIDYDASKAGVISLTKNVALQFAPFVNVNAVAPGWVDTDMNKDLDMEIIKEESQKIYLKRFAKPDEIAKLITFLASDDASYINAEVIKIDGGY